MVSLRILGTVAWSAAILAGTTCSTYYCLSKADHWVFVEQGPYYGSLVPLSIKVHAIFMVRLWVSLALLTIIAGFTAIYLCIKFRRIAKLSRGFEVIATTNIAFKNRIDF